MSAEHLRPAPQWPSGLFCFFLFCTHVLTRLNISHKGGSLTFHQAWVNFLTGEPHWLLNVDRGARAAGDGWMECVVDPPHWRKI